MRLIFLTLSFLTLSFSAFAEEASSNNLAEKAPLALESNKLQDATETVSAEEIKAVAKDNRSEAEIPLNLQSAKKADNAGSGALRIFFSLTILGVLGFGAVIFLRKYSRPQSSKHQTQIKVLQQHYLGPKKSLAIVRVAGESILIGVTDHNISLIKPLSLMDDEIPEESPGQFNSVMTDFDEEEVETNRPNRKTARELDKDEEFAISGIKDIVSKRLKGMRSLQ